MEKERGGGGDELPPGGNDSPNGHLADWFLFVIKLSLSWCARNIMSLKVIIVGDSKGN